VLGERQQRQAYLNYISIIPRMVQVCNISYQFDFMKKILRVLKKAIKNLLLHLVSLKMVS